MTQSRYVLTGRDDTGWGTERKIMHSGRPSSSELLSST